MYTSFGLFHCGYQKEPSHWEGSFEHPQHIHKLMGKNIITALTPKVSFSGPIMYCFMHSLIYKHKAAKTKIWVAY